MLARSLPAAQAAGARGSRAAASRPLARRPRAFSGPRRVAVLATAESSEAPKQQQQRRGRAPRTVTVPIADVQPGQEYEGTVTSVEAYGAFVSIGSDTDGLVHVSQLSDGYVKNVADVVKVGAKVRVKVLTVDAGQKRLALTMKGMGGAGAKRGGGGGPVKASFDMEDDAEEEAGFAMEAGDVALDGVVFRVDEPAGETEGYDEADEFESEAEPTLALVAAVQDSIVEGKVTGVEDFGVVVEWSDAAGAKRSGLLHVSQMRAPAAAAAAELGEPAGGAAAEGDEGEFAGDLYVDVGGVDKPSRYYKVGDAVSCFVMGVEGTKISLTQDPEALALDGALDEEGEALDLEEERLLARAAGEDQDAFGGEGEEGEEDAAPMVVGDATASIYYAQSSAAAKTAAGPAFIRGKSGAAVAPAGFPSRGLGVADANILVAAANRLVDIDDAGDEAELVDYWSNELAPVTKDRLAALGGKIEANEEGELAVVARDGVDAEGDALELLAGVGDAELDALVEALMADEEEDEAELPYNARRNPGTRV